MAGKWTWLAVAAVAIALIASLVVYQRHPATEIHTLAVLPFTVLNEQPEDAYLSLGLADALITRMANSR